MSKLLTWMCSAAMVIAAGSNAFADNAISQQSSGSSSGNSGSGNKQMNQGQKAPYFEQGMELPANKYQAGYNAPACTKVKNGWDFDIFGSFIYWHVSQEDMDFAYVQPVTDATTAAANIPGAVAYQNFDYKPGFKVGLGFTWNYDGWISWAEYTWMHQSTTDSYAAPALPTGAAGAWAANDWFVEYSGFSGSTAASSWKMNLDMVDFEFSRPYYEGTMLTIAPYAGLRALWIRQNMNITLSSIGDVNTSTNHSACWSLGPNAGVSGHWLLGCGVRFEGNMNGSILYTQYTKISHKQQATGFLSNGATTTNFNVLRPMTQLGVGMGWGSYFSGNECFFDISARYDFMYFWDQNVMRSWVSQLQGYDDPSGDLEMHGLTLTLGVDF